MTTVKLSLGNKSGEEMIRTIFHLLILSMVIVFFGCNLEDDGFDGCVTCADTITWKSYGRYSFNNAGSDSTAWAIVDDCGWHVHSGHAGGYGDTLQVASCSTRECPSETDNPYETGIVEDFCDLALYIPFFPFRGTGNTASATIDADEPDHPCREHGHSVWYYFEADRDGYVTANTAGSDFDTIIAVLQGSCLDFRQIDCDDDSGPGLTSEIIFPISIGESYYLMVGSYGTNAAGGNLTLEVTYRECLPHDEGVVLVWAYQSFQGFRVRAGWTGSTGEGIGIGSTLQEFLSTYPYFIEGNNGIFLYESGDIRVRATFDQNERLEEFMVGHYFRS